ncbi:MAG: hypothetical protein HFF18_14480, partial [Oscillospiraceae bacterium]|nr:hypothetical protein [Oscillospiraceae bacterium]
CAGWAGIFSSSKEKSAGILDVFRAFLTPQDGKRPVQTVCQEILNRLLGPSPAALSTPRRWRGVLFLFFFLKEKEAKRTSSGHIKKFFDA